MTVSPTIGVAPLTGTLATIFLLLLNATIDQKIEIEESTEVYPQDYGPKLLQGNDTRFDFVIVGAGTGGCVLANRLSRNSKWNILLLEAGDVPSPTTEVPYLSYSLRNSNEEWKFFTESSNSLCQGYRDQRCSIMQGKVVGGTSTINNLQYSRGNVEDFQKWDLWGINEITKSYEQIENYQGGNTAAFGHLGTDGEIIINELHRKDPLILKAIYESAQEFDYEKIEYADQHLGYQEYLGTLKSNQRDNMAKAFLVPVKDRPNLFVARNSTVKSVTTHFPDDKRVRGVIVEINNKEIEILAKREVILSAGTINTPKILLLSGIGPQEHLKKMNIPCLLNLAVGKNLRDTIALPIFVGLDRMDEVPKEDPKVVLDSVYNYLIYRDGYLAGTGANSLVGAINTRKDPYNYPNVKVYHLFFDYNDAKLREVLESYGMLSHLIKCLVTFNKNHRILVFMPTVLQTKSKGKVKLKSTQYKDMPIIKGNYLKDPENSDYEVMMSGFNYVLGLIMTDTLMQRNATFLEVDIPDCRSYKFETPQYKRCYIQAMGFPQGQVVGTMKMGDTHTCGDGSLVVNHELLVQGIRHLRIVDASVIPRPLSVNKEATVAMLANKISESIKTAWTEKPLKKTTWVDKLFT